MADTSKLKDGRSWKVTNRGIKSLSRDYLVLLDDITGTNGEADSFPGVPAIGSVHPVYNYLKVLNYDVKEGAGSAKKTITVTVNYGIEETESGGSGTEEDPSFDIAVESWGWDSGTATKELTEDYSNPPKKVVNSAGDPFDRVPQVEGYAPTFTKVFKSEERMAGFQALSCRVNSAAVTIGGMECAARTLLIGVAEEAIIGDVRWHYRYTVQLKYRPETWDVTLIQAGMRCKDPSDKNNLKLCTVIDKETGRVCRVTSPALLDAQGYQVSPTDQSAPYTDTFKAYPEVAVPNIFVSEPERIPPNS